MDVSIREIDKRQILNDLNEEKARNKIRNLQINIATKKDKFKYHQGESAEYKNKLVSIEV